MPYFPLPLVSRGEKHHVCNLLVVGGLLNGAGEHFSPHVGWSAGGIKWLAVVNRQAITV